MRLKLYRAPCMTEAMAQLRAELGPDAIILATRRTAQGVELTAALEPPSPPPSPAPPPLAWHGVPETLRHELGAGELATALAARFRFVPLPWASGPLLLAGPPGAGKTLTVARLATRLVLGGTAPSVITADGRRAGAAEELAAYTRLLGIPLTVANQPATLARALARAPGLAPVLIDTAGVNPFDAGETESLAALAAAAGATLLLVLPAGMDAAEAGETAAAFAALGAAHLLATRLDIARRLGALLAAAARGLAFTEAGTGPGASDGLTALTPDLLAARLRAIPEPP